MNSKLQSKIMGTKSVKKMVYVIVDELHKLFNLYNE